MLLSCFTPQYCSPQLLPTLTCPLKEDAPTDVWALGCILHLLLSVANTSWNKPFGPSAADEAEIGGQPKEQWNAYLTACIKRHQDAWVCCACGLSVSAAFADPWHVWNQSHLDGCLLSAICVVMRITMIIIFDKVPCSKPSGPC